MIGTAMSQSWFKYLAPIIIARISLAGMVIVAVIQTGSASSVRVEAIVQEINTSIIPSVQKELERHETEMDTLREEVAYLRGATQHKAASKMRKGGIILDFNGASSDLNEDLDKTAKSITAKIPSLSIQ